MMSRISHLVNSCVLMLCVVPAPVENFFYFNDPLFISTVVVVSQ